MPMTAQSDKQSHGLWNNMALQMTVFSAAIIILIAIAIKYVF